MIHYQDFTCSPKAQAIATQWLGRVEGTDAIENNDVKIPIRIHDNDDEEMAVESTNNGNGNEVNEVVSRQEESIVEYLPESVAVFTSVLLKNAAQTISHSFAALSRLFLFNLLAIN